MAVSSEFRDYLEEHLSGLGPVRFKRMFGGAGLYLHDVIFGLIIEDVLYLKTDAATRPLFQAAGSRPFEYEKKSGKVVGVRYWSLPETALDDPDEAVEWARRALAAGE